MPTPRITPEALADQWEGQATLLEAVPMSTETGRTTQRDQAALLRQNAAELREALSQGGS